MPQGAQEPQDIFHPGSDVGLQEVFRISDLQQVRLWNITFFCDRAHYGSFEARDRFLATGLLVKTPSKNKLCGFPALLIYLAALQSKGMGLQFDGPKIQFYPHRDGVDRPLPAFEAKAVLVILM